LTSNDRDRDLANLPTSTFLAAFDGHARPIHQLVEESDRLPEIEALTDKRVMGMSKPSVISSTLDRMAQRSRRPVVVK